MNFPGKKGLCQFLDIPIIDHCTKNQKKLLSYFWEKHQTDGQMDRQTDRQWWFYRTLHRMEVQLVVNYVSIAFCGMSLSDYVYRAYFRKIKPSRIRDLGEKCSFEKKSFLLIWIKSLKNIFLLWVIQSSTALLDYLSPLLSKVPFQWNKEPFCKKKII